MKAVSLPNWFCVVVLTSFFMFVQPLNAQRAIHNPNDYDLWVCTGSYVEGVISLTGGTGAPDSYASKGWFRIPAKGNLQSDVARSATHIVAFAYDSKGKKVYFPTKSQSGVFYYSPNQFSKNFRARSTNGLISAIKKSGGQARKFSSLRAYYNPSTQRNELRGPSIEGVKQVYLTGITSKLPANYRLNFRWNPNQKWTTHTLEPGKAKFFWSGGAKVSPQFRIDQSTNSGLQEKIYSVEGFRVTLKTGSSPSWKNARQYAISKQGNLYKITDNY